MLSRIVFFLILGCLVSLGVITHPINALEMDSIVLEGGAADYRRIDLSWKANTPAPSENSTDVEGRYEVYKDGNLFKVYNAVFTCGKYYISHSSCDYPVEEQSTHRYYVRAYDSEGNFVGQSNEVMVTTPAKYTFNYLPAFPGAEGFGAKATGGRGGRVAYVTNLNSDGPGSLKDALLQTGARYILFKVSGEARLSGWFNMIGDYTLAGQTSPGGIITRGFISASKEDKERVYQGMNNVIIRHLRNRPNCHGSDDAFRLHSAKDVIIDHCSMGRAGDESFQLSNANFVTIQNTILAETVGEHYGLGGMLVVYTSPRFPLNNLSIHHNMWNRVAGRLPEISNNDGNANDHVFNYELSNNLIWDPNGATIWINDTGRPYNPQDKLYLNINWVGNYMRTNNDHRAGMITTSLLSPGFSVYVADNRMSLYPQYSDYEIVYGNNSFYANHPNTDVGEATRLAERHPYAPVTYTPSLELSTYMTHNVGAFPRDPMDARLLYYVQNNTLDPSKMYGAYKYLDGQVVPAPNVSFANCGAGINPVDQFVTDLATGEWLYLTAGQLVDDSFYVKWRTAPPPPLDSDDDGMPDWWEVHNGLNPLEQDHNGSTLSELYTTKSGYTNLEVYLNRLADHVVDPMAVSLTEGQPENYPIIANASASVGQVNAGTATDVTFSVTPADPDNVERVELSLAMLNDPFASPAPGVDRLVERNGNTWTLTYTVPAHRDPGDYQVLAHVVAKENVEGENEHGYAIIPLQIVVPLDEVAPGTPTGLNATADNSSTVTLTWTPSADTDVVGYRIYRDGVGIDSTNRAYFTDRGLTPNTQYQYTVSTYDASGNHSGQSGSDSVQTPNNTAPTIVITNITHNTNPAEYEGERVSIGFNAFDSDGFIAKVELYQGDTRVGEDASPSYSFNWTEATVGSYEFTAVATDNLDAQTTISFSVRIGSNNEAPVIAEIRNQTVNYGAPVTIEVEASDDNNLIYSVSGLPIGASFQNQQFTWTPTLQQVGRHIVTFTVFDGQAYVSRNVTITVLGDPAEQPLSIDNIRDKTVDFGNELAFDVIARDDNPDLLTYSVRELPEGAVFEGTHFSWTPTQEQVGIYFVTFIVSNNEESINTKAKIIVRDPNSTPNPQLQVEEAGADYINLIWSPPTDVTVTVAGYRIYRNDVQVGSISAAETRFTVTSLPPGNSGRYTVCACDWKGNVVGTSQSVEATNTGSYSIYPVERNHSATAWTNTVYVFVSATGLEWNVLSNVGWITINPEQQRGTGNGKFEYSITPNTGETSRVGTITLSGQGQTATYTVYQKTRKEPSVVGFYSSPTYQFSFLNAVGGLAGDSILWNSIPGMSWHPVVGDWDGDGDFNVGFYSPEDGQFRLDTGDNTNGTADVSLDFGPSAQSNDYMPVVGDWDGDGKDTIGLYCPETGAFLLTNKDEAAMKADLIFNFRPTNSTFKPIAGDWDGDGIDSVGLYNAADGVFYLKRSFVSVCDELVFAFGPVGEDWRPVAGDWDGDQVDTIGLYDPATGEIYLRNSNCSGEADMKMTVDAEGVPIS